MLMFVRPSVRLFVCLMKTCLELSIFILKQSGSVQGQFQVSFRSVSGSSQVSLRSVSGQSQVSLRSDSGQSVSPRSVSGHS